MCKSESAETKKEEDTESVKQPINEKTPLTSQQASVPIVEDSHHHQEQPLEAPTKMQKVKTILEKSKNLLLGLFCCVGLGLFNGSMMVPARFVEIVKSENTKLSCSDLIQTSPLAILPVLELVLLL